MLLQDHPSNSTQASTSPAKLIVTKIFHPANSSPPNLKNNHRGSTSTDHEHAYDHLHPAERHKTYLAGLVNACVLLPTITALFTIFCYLLLPTIPLIPQNHLSVLVAGVLTASLATVLVAFFRRSAATYQEGNSQSFSNSEMCLNRLETRLAVLKQINGTSPADETPEDKLLREVGIKEAESALRKAKYICKSCNSYQWITGAGYAHLQQALYDVEEALIKIEPISMLISEAKHDQAALQDANMSNNKQLSDELQQSIEDLNAHYAPPKQQKDVVDFLQEKLYHFLYDHQDHQKQQSQEKESLKEKERQARITIYYVRQTLNDFRINRLFELVQQRSNLVLAITVTGVITYLLVCLALLSPIQKPILATLFVSAAAYFFVGSAAGLFGRLYSVSTADRTINSYGLPTARTNAAAHLSGVAGVGGVFVTQALLQIANLAGPGHPVQPFAFSLPNLLVAATFGLTPNLLIKNLQKQAEKSIADLESTKPSAIGKNGN